MHLFGGDNFFVRPPLRLLPPVVVLASSRLSSLWKVGTRTSHAVQRHPCEAEPSRSPSVSHRIPVPCVVGCRASEEAAAGQSTFKFKGAGRRGSDENQDDGIAASRPHCTTNNHHAYTSRHTPWRSQHHLSTRLCCPTIGDALFALLARCKMSVSLTASRPHLGCVSSTDP